MWCYFWIHNVFYIFYSLYFIHKNKKRYKEEFMKKFGIVVTCSEGGFSILLDERLKAKNKEKE